MNTALQKFFDRNATIVGATIVLDFETHSEAFAALQDARRELAAPPLPAPPGSAAEMEQQPLTEDEIAEWVLPGEVRAKGDYACVMWVIRKTERAHHIGDAA